MSVCMNIDTRTQIQTETETETATATDTETETQTHQRVKEETMLKTPLMKPSRTILAASRPHSYIHTGIFDKSSGA